MSRVGRAAAGSAAFRTGLARRPVAGGSGAAVLVDAVAFVFLVLVAAAGRIFSFSGSSN